MKKFIVTLIAILFTFGAAFASISNGIFKDLLKTGTPEQVQNAIKGGVSMDMGDALCYSIKHSQNHGIISTLIENGANLNNCMCLVPAVGRVYPMWYSTYYKNRVTTEDLLKLGVSGSNFSLYQAGNLELVKTFAKYADNESIERILKYTREEMNNTNNLPAYRAEYTQVAEYLQSIDVNMPQFVGKNKVDIVMELGQPSQEMKVDTNHEMWTYYHHVDDTHFSGQSHGTSTYWGFGVSTINANVSGGYTASNLEKLTLIFKNGVVIKAKKNYDRQLH